MSEKVKRAHHFSIFSLTSALIAYLVFSPSISKANNFNITGPGPRVVAMGGAFTAVADDFTGGFENPAGILMTTKTRVGLGYQYVSMDLEANGDNLDRDSTWVDGLLLGFAFTIPLSDALKDRIAFGYNLYQPVNFVMNIEIPESSEPQFVLLESYPRANVMHVALATDALPWLLMGAGATFSTDMGGSLDLKPGIRGVGGSDAILTTVDQEVQPIISPDLGLMLRPGLLSETFDGLTAGFTWRYPFYIDLAIPVSILLGTIPLQLDFTSKFIYTPAQYTLGLAYRFDNSLLLALDLSYKVWSDFKIPTLEIETNIEIPLLPLELLPGHNDPPNFKDTINLSAGGEYRVFEGESLDVLLRAGYSFEPTPVPEQSEWSNFLDGDKHIFSTGFALALKEIFGVDLRKANPALNLAFSYQLHSETNHVKDSDVNEINPGYPEISGEGALYFIGSAITLEYGK